MSLDTLRSYGLNVGPVAAGISGLDDVKQMRSRLKALEDAGITMNWQGEQLGPEAFTYAQRLLNASEKIVIGLGIARALERSPKNAACAQWTITEEYPDRFLMGLGASAATREARQGHGRVPPRRHDRGGREHRAPQRQARPLAPRPSGRTQSGRSRFLGGHDGLTTFLTTPAHTKWAREAPRSGPLPHGAPNGDPGQRREPSPQLDARAPRLLPEPAAPAQQVPQHGLQREDFARPGSDALIDGLFRTDRRTSSSKGSVNTSETERIR